MYYLYLFARWLTNSFPRAFSYRVAELLAWCKHVFARRDRRLVLKNLMPVLNDRRRAVLCAFEVVKNFAYYLVDFFSLARVDNSFIEQYVVFEDIERLDDLLARKKGVILLSAHLGNYELGAALLGLKGYKPCALALTHKDKRINALFNAQREICGVEVAHPGMGVKKCFRALSEGKPIALVGDRDFFGQGAEVFMFGKKCVIPRGPAVISLKTGAHILPVFLVREGKYHYRYIFCPPISPLEGGREQTEDVLIKKCAAVLEDFISRYPEQWYLFEDYWIG